MSDARNVYPRLCWGCLDVIEDYEHDRALMTYGGYCTYCHTIQDGEKPGLRKSLRGETERMNNVAEREELLREVSMSDENEIQGSGTIDEPAIKVNYTYNGLPVNPTLLNPAGGAVAYVGDVPWQYIPPPAPWQQPQQVTLVSHTLTEDDIRALVEEAVHKALYPEQDGLVDTRQHRRVRQWDENGTEWRGVLYRVSKEE